MNTYCNINETMLSEVYGGNSGGAAVVAALGCAAGGREGDESPFECARREVYEELGIHLDEDCLLWSKIYPSVIFKGKKSVFMVGQLRQEQFDNIIFGDEGQGYQLMNVEEFLSSSQVVPQLQERLKDYLKVSD